MSKSDKPYCPHAESDAAFALSFAAILAGITLVLAVVGIISLF